MITARSNGCFACAATLGLLSLGCPSNQQAIGADLREAVPFYVCTSLKAARAVGAPLPQTPGSTPINKDVPLPDQLQLQFQTTTTTTQQHQGQVGISTPIVLNYQGQYQRAFADSQQVTLQYNADKLKVLEQQCAAGVVPPKPLQLTATSEGITAEALSSAPAPPPPTKEQVCASATITTCDQDRVCHSACGGNHGCDESCSGQSNFAKAHGCWSGPTSC
jgi:hypothetical protein